MATREANIGKHVFGMRSLCLSFWRWRGALSDCVPCPSSSRGLVLHMESIIIFSVSSTCTLKKNGILTATWWGVQRPCDRQSVFCSDIQIDQRSATKTCSKYSSEEYYINIYMFNDWLHGIRNFTHNTNVSGHAHCRWWTLYTLLLHASDRADSSIVVSTEKRSSLRQPLSTWIGKVLFFWYSI